MAFKGVLPSQLWLHYTQPGGLPLMELDMNVAIDIQDKINQATGAKSSTGLRKLTADDSSAVIRRRNERRQARKRAEEGLNNT